MRCRWTSPCCAPISWCPWGTSGFWAERTSQLGLNPTPAVQRGPHLLGLTIPDDVRATVLADLAAADCYVALRGRALRISPRLHVTEHDIDRLLQALQEAVISR